jgi:hypothetical protein
MRKPIVGETWVNRNVTSHIVTIKYVHDDCVVGLNSTKDCWVFDINDFLARFNPPKRGVYMNVYRYSER